MINSIEDFAAALGTTVDRLKRDVYKYTDCGAWIEWDETGIRFGTIVEGADCDGPSDSLEFPFEIEEYEASMEEIERIADAMWHEWNDYEEDEED